MSAPLESEKLRFANPTIPFLRAQDIQCIIDDLQMLNSGGGGGSGTVTSVGLSLPSLFNVTVSPVTTSGSLTAVLNTQAANTFFAGPSSGSATAPTFRVLTSTDIPSLSSVYVPYTGATATVDLNNKILTDIQKLGVGIVSIPNFITATGIQPASVATATGTSSAVTGAINLTAAQGGNTTIATTGTGGTGGAINITSGAPGTAASAVTNSSVGTSGAVTIGTANGSANTTASSTGTNGGQSGNLNIKTGNSGAASLGSTNNFAGSSGSVNVSTGTGAAGGGATAGSGGTVADGGVSGYIQFLTGNGGVAQNASYVSNGGGTGGIYLTTGDAGSGFNATTNRGGNSGAIVLQGGTGGTGSTNNGSDGSIQLLATGANGTGTVIIQSLNGQGIYVNDTNSALLNNGGTTIQGGGVGVSVPTDILVLGNQALAFNGSLKFNNSTNANSVTFVSGVSSGNATYTLPTAYPAADGYVLSCTTAGVLSWVAH